MNIRTKSGIAASIAALSLGLTACGSSSKSASTPPATGSGSPSAAPAVSVGAGRTDPYANAAVQTCLKAAGITLPTGRAFPSGARRSDFPTGSRPSGSFPTGTRPSGGGRFGGNSAQGAKIRTALKACGITLPTGGFRPRSGTARPTAAPTT